MRRLINAVAVLAPIALHAQAIDLAHYRPVDLTWPLNAQTLYWPTSPSTFKLDQLSYGKTPGGYFYSAYTFSAPEHGGTHLDAPIHFAEHGNTADKIPLEQLIAPAVVIDVAAQAASDRDYRLTSAELAAFEKKHGRIRAGTIVMLRTDWSKKYPDRKSYFGDDTPNDASKLHFPGYGADAVRTLVENRKIAALGIDTPSIDYGPSADFIVHQLAMGKNVIGLENVMNLDKLPAVGATVIALPMKTEGGSGGPVRIVALVRR